MYFLDPDLGARRRHRLLDRLTHARRVGGEGLDTAVRDLGNRTRGLAAAVRARVQRGDTDDRIVEERVRAALGRLVSHPGAIDVLSELGRVTLAGPVLAGERDSLLAGVARVRGVTEVVDRLDVCESAIGVPALQGDPRREHRFELRQEYWAPAVRLLTGTAAAAAVLYALRRRDRLASGVGLAGLTLLARSATNTPVRRLVGAGTGRRSVDIRKAVTIDAPPARVYAFLTEWEQWPQWMSHVREVTQRGTLAGLPLTHWVVDGPLGVPVSWDAVTTVLSSNEEIAWKTVGPAAVQHAGVIRLIPVNGGTLVDLRMSYKPPAGAVGHALAQTVGRDPKRQMDADLARLKTTVETGRPPEDASAASGHALAPAG
jgi:uncharacterized membrane protein